MKVNGMHLVPDFSGALYWPEQAMLLVADMHFEKGSRYAGTGTLLPPYDTAATLDKLDAAIRRHRPKQIVCLGDSFDDAQGGARLQPADRSRLQRLIAAHDWLWVTGNHDPVPPIDLGGTVVAEWAQERLILRHEPTGALGELAGHLHPKARVKTRAGSASRPCFISDGRCAILPAFGTFTGGLNVFDMAFAKLVGSDFSVWLLGDSQVYSVTADRLRR